jgi:hypothetical protein
MVYSELSCPKLGLDNSYYQKNILRKNMKKKKKKKKKRRSITWIFTIRFPPTLQYLCQDL